MQGPPLHIALDEWANGILLLLKASDSAPAFERYRTAVTTVFESWRTGIAPSRARSALETIPPQALRLVFRHLCPLDRLCLAQTARRFRYFALAHPDVFNDISTLSVPMGVNTAKLMSGLLRKSSPTHPLELEFAIDVWDYRGSDACFSMAEAHLPRISHLSLQLSRHHHTADNGFGLNGRAVQILDSYLSSPAPALRHLRIFVATDRSYPGSVPLASTIFNRHAPRLTRCYLKNLSLRGGYYAAFSQLLSLTYIPRSRRISLTVLRNIFVSCPRLLYLELGIQKFKQPSGEKGGLLLPTHATLRNFFVDWVKDGSEMLLEYLMHSDNMRRLVCSRPVGYHSLAGMPFLRLFAIIRLELGRAVCEAEATHVSTGRALLLRYRTVRYVPIRASMFDPSVHAALTTLSIHEFFWPGPDDPPVMPCLTSLRIMLASCKDVAASHSTFPGIFLATSAWHLPCLRTLQLTYWLEFPCKSTARACCCSNRLSLSLADVHSFVAQCLPPAGQRLASITLSGVEVIDRLPETWLERISELSEQFTLLPTCTPSFADASARVWHGEFEDLFRDNLIQP